MLKKTKKKIRKNNHTGATKRDALKRKTTNNGIVIHFWSVTFCTYMCVVYVTKNDRYNVDDSSEYNM